MCNHTLNVQTSRMGGGGGGGSLMRIQYYFIYLFYVRLQMEFNWKNRFELFLIT